MRRQLRRLWGTKGVSAVEFGLILPLLLIILLGVIDYGWVFFVRLNMINAAREGARVGVTKGTEDDANPVYFQPAKDAAEQYLASAGLSAAVTVDPPTPHDTNDDSVRVVVTVDPFTPLVGFVPVPNRMTASAEMRWEMAPVETPSP